MLDTANVTAADSSLNLRSLVVFFTQGSQTPGWQRKMGTARVNCISGCECTGMQLGNKAARATQAGINLGYAMTQVRGKPLQQMQALRYDYMLSALSKGVGTPIRSQPEAQKVSGCPAGVR